MKLAKREVAGRMLGNKSAITDKVNLEPHRERLKMMLQAIALRAKGDVQETISSTAFEFLPFGLVNAEACFPPDETPFILLDTGTFDFMGNNSAIICALMSDKSVLREDQIIDALFSSALIYYERDKDFEARRWAIFAPKLSYMEIPSHLVPQAIGYAQSFILFLVLHELAHIILQPVDLSDVNPWQQANRHKEFDVNPNADSHFEECAADYVAYDLIMEFATFCVPDPQMAVSILSGLDIGLTFLMFFQNTFPKFVDNAGIIHANEELGHPAAFQRRIYFRERVKEKMKPFSDHLGVDFLSEAHRCEELLFKFTEIIHKGAKPSPEFKLKRKIAMDLYQ